MAPLYGTVSPPSIIIVDEYGSRTAYAPSTDDDTSDISSHLTTQSESYIGLLANDDNLLDRAIRVLGRPLPSLNTFKLMLTQSNNDGFIRDSLEERIGRYEEDDTARALKIAACCILGLPFVGLVVFAMYLVITEAVPMGILIEG